SDGLVSSSGIVPGCRCTDRTAACPPCTCGIVHFFFFFHDTATTEIYTLFLHDALPICALRCRSARGLLRRTVCESRTLDARHRRSEEHTSELQSRRDLVCRLLLEKKN